MTRKEELRKQVDYPSDPHTRLKHAFYRWYVACWMGRVLQGRWAKPGTIIDGFAGSGMYSDGLDGSAIMIAKLFREHLCRPNFQPLTYVTNDLDPRRCDALGGRMKALPVDDRIHHVPVGPKKFEDIVTEVRKHHAPPGTQTLWIIDPYGLKQIPWSIVAEIVKVPKNDAVITFMADEAHRYRSNPAMVSVMNGLYGDDSWRNIPEGLSTAQSKAALVKLYCDKLEALGCHTSSFVKGHLKLPTGGQEKCPLVANKDCPLAAMNLPVVGGRHWWSWGGQVKALTPCPCRAWARRTESPLVWHRCAWCSSLSTVAVASVLGISSSNPLGCRLDETATDLRS